MKFTGMGKVVPAGTVVATLADEVSGEASLEYETVSRVELGEDGLGSVGVRALVAGKESNVPAGTVTVLSTPVSGVTSVVNTDVIKGGADIEADTALLERFMPKSATREPAATRHNMCNGPVKCRASVQHG